MSWKRILLLVFVVALIAVTALGGVTPVEASSAVESAGNETSEGNESDDDGDDESSLLSPLENLREEVSELNDDLDDRMGHTFTDVLTEVFFQPFHFMAQQLIEYLTLLLSYTPSVHGNEAVEEIHGQALIVSYLLASTGFLLAGVLYMTGPLLGISFREVRMILPRLVVALLFGTFALPLLQLAVDLANALTWAFRPSQLTMETEQLLGVSTGMVLVWVTKGVLLLAVVLMYILRNVVLLFLAGIAPLIALAWAFPRSKKYADSFIGLWWAALVLAPLNMLALSFMFEMLALSLDSPVQSISNWVYGVASLVLLIILPYQLYGVSQAVVGPATMFAGAAIQTVSNRFEQRGGQRSSSASGVQRQRKRRIRRSGSKYEFSDGEMREFLGVVRKNARRDLKSEYETRVRKPDVKPHEWAELDDDQKKLDEFEDDDSSIIWKGGR